MKSNYDRSKSISRKTTKNYHPRADDPRLLKICRHVSTVFADMSVRTCQTFQKRGNCASSEHSFAGSQL